VQSDKDALPGKEVFASASLGPFDAHINAITFVPVANVPWEGRLVIASGEGGLSVVDVEGQQDSTWQGSTFSALAASPGFDLRGLKVSLVLALKSDGSMQSFIVDDARGQLIELPVAGLPTSGITAICAIENDDKTASFLIGQDDKSLAVWSLGDSGEAQLGATKAKSGTLAIAINNCAASGTGAIATGNKGGLFRLALNDKISMLQGVESAPGKVASLGDGDANLVLISDPAAGNLNVYDANFLPLYTLKAPKALSTPGAANPGALAVSMHSFGGAGFSAGLLAVADDSTNRIALVVADTIPKKP
jgi:hypothetical protein